MCRMRRRRRRRSRRGILIRRLLIKARLWPIFHGTRENKFLHPRIQKFFRQRIHRWFPLFCERKRTMLSPIGLGGFGWRGGVNWAGLVPPFFTVVKPPTMDLAHPLPTISASSITMPNRLALLSSNSSLQFWLLLSAQIYHILHE